MKAWDLFCVHCTTDVAVDAADAIAAAAIINTAAAAGGSKARSHSRQFDGSFLIKADSFIHFSLPKYMIQDHSTIAARIFIATYIVDIMFGKSKTIKIFRS